MKSKVPFLNDEALYEYIIANLAINPIQKEDKILELWKKGENNCYIANNVGYTEGTIRNRKKDIIKRYNAFIETLKVTQ